MKNLFVFVSVATVLLFSTLVQAEQWQLEPAQSQLHFISTKKNSIAEINQFDKFSANVDCNGHVTMNIDLSSVNTAVAIRDKRIQTELFEVSDYANATLTTKVDNEVIKAIDEGRNEQLTLDAVLDLHGQRNELEIDVIITRLAGAKLSVVSAKPVIVNAAEFNLVAGIDKLMAIAKLPSISHAVPVTFNLTFKLKRD